MSKRINMNARPNKPTAADEWVGEKASGGAKPKRLTCNVDPELYARLRIHSVKTDTPITELVRRMVAQELERTESA